MLCTVTNLSASLTLNDFDTITNGSVATTGVATLVATGGQRKYPLPHPFQDIVLAPSGTKQLAFHQQDFRHKPILGLPLEPVQEWVILIQRKVVSLAFAAQPGVVNPEDLSVDTI